MKVKKYLLIFTLIQLLALSAYSENNDKWLIGPKLGISTYFGVGGLEFQKDNWSISLGIAGFANIIGVKYYFSGLNNSWYIGPYCWKGTKNEDDDLDLLIGFGGGHRWQFKNGINLGLGVGIHYWEENVLHNGVGIAPELYCGWAF